MVLLRKVAAGDFPDPRSVAPWLPRPLADLILKVMARDPNVVPFQPLGKPRMREWVQSN